MEAAAGIYRMINLKMADGIRLMTLRRGVDPRRFALLSFGGAAGLHAVEVARELEIKRIIVPMAASVLSAWGMLTSDLRYEVSRTHYGAGARITSGRSARPVRPSWSSRPPAGCAPGSAGRCRSSGPPRCVTASRFSRSMSRSTVSTGMQPSWSTQIEDRFHRRHEELYTYASRDQEVVFVNARVAAVGEVSQRGQDRDRARRLRRARRAERGRPGSAEWREVPVYALDDLRPGHALAGPAIIEAETTTVVVDAGDKVTVNALGWLDIALR